MFLFHDVIMIWFYGIYSIWHHSISRAVCKTMYHRSPLQQGWLVSRSLGLMVMGILVVNSSLWELAVRDECGTHAALQWRHNERDGVSNHQPNDCLLNRLFGRRSKLRVTGLCVGNSPGTGEFPAQRASNAENVFIWWRHHGVLALIGYIYLKGLAMS